MSLITETYLDGLDAYTVTIRHCGAHLVYFSPCRTLGGRGRRPSDTVQPLTGERPESSAPSTPHHIRCRALHTSTAITTPLTGAIGQGRAPGMGERIRKDNDHDLRHTPQRSAIGKTNCSSPEGGGVDDLSDPPCMSPFLFEPIKGERGIGRTTRTHVLSPLILALTSITPSTPRDRELFSLSRLSLYPLLRELRCK